MKHSLYHTIRKPRILYFLISTISLLIVAISCSKTQQNLAARPIYPTLAQSSALNTVKAYLRDSLSPSAYDSLEFPDIIVDTASSGNLFLRLPSLGDPVSRRFFLVETTQGLMPLKAAGFLIQLTITPANAVSGSLPAANGIITKTWLNGSTVYVSPVISGFVTALHPDRTIASDASDKTTDSDFDGTGETLPDILIEAPMTTAEEGTYYMDLGALMDGGSSGSYSSSGGPGGTVNPYAVLPQAEKPAINIKGYLGCLDQYATQLANNTYFITLYTALPTSDPNTVTASNGYIGQSFIGLRVASGGSGDSQYIGFAPASAAVALQGYSTPGMLVDMQYASYCASYTVQISAASFAQAEALLQTLSQTAYNFNTFNGNSFAYDFFYQTTGQPNLDPAFDLLNNGPLNPNTSNGLYTMMNTLNKMGAAGITANPAGTSSVGKGSGNCSAVTGGGTAGLTTAP
ncbi:MAG: hypothetical protein P4L51_06065 [Puia sp.]|nr:hypothetical protein [Puia sp.]